MWFGNSFSFLFARKASKSKKQVSYSYLEQCNTRIRILERGKSAIRVGRDKRFLLQDAEIEEFLMIWNAEFFENDGDFPWVGALFFVFNHISLHVALTLGQMKLWFIHTWTWPYNFNGFVIF